MLNISFTYSTKCYIFSQFVYAHQVFYIIKLYLNNTIITHLHNVLFITHQVFSHKQHSLCCIMYLKLISIFNNFIISKRILQILLIFIIVE